MALEAVVVGLLFMDVFFITETSRVSRRLADNFISSIFLDASNF